jgi:hypothetical protein
MKSVSKSTHVAKLNANTNMIVLTSIKTYCLTSVGLYATSVKLS